MKCLAISHWEASRKVTTKRAEGWQKHQWFLIKSITGKQFLQIPLKGNSLNKGKWYQEVERERHEQLTGGQWGEESWVSFLLLEGSFFSRVQTFVLEWYTTWRFLMVEDWSEDFYLYFRVNVQLTQTSIQLLIRRRSMRKQITNDVDDHNACFFQFVQ